MIGSDRTLPIMDRVDASIKRVQKMGAKGGMDAVKGTVAGALGIRREEAIGEVKGKGIDGSSATQTGSTRREIFLRPIISLKAEGVVEGAGWRTWADLLCLRESWPHSQGLPK